MSLNVTECDILLCEHCITHRVLTVIAAPTLKLYLFDTMLLLRGWRVWCCTLSGLRLRGQAMVAMVGPRGAAAQKVGGFASLRRASPLAEGDRGYPLLGHLLPKVIGD